MSTEPDSWSQHFSLPPDRIWLNASHQGPLPDVGAAATAEMVRWKQQPHNLITPAPFTDVPARLRNVLASLIGADSTEVALANSASYGLHLISNGLSLTEGDEVIVAANDFPSDILPWTRLRSAGVVVKTLIPNDRVLTAAEIAPALSPRTRVVCLPWVHSFSGAVVNLDAVGELCRAAGALFVVNAAQGIGGLPLQVSDHPIDALTSVGFKYLCGPYGTGFCWIGERMIDQLTPTKLYWLSALTADDLASPDLDLDSIEVPNTAARHDIFGTANFFNFAAFAESAKLVSDIGIDRIRGHNVSLAERLIDGLQSAGYEVQSHGPGARQSAIVFVKPRNGDLAEMATLLDTAGIDVARRSGMVRFAPHLYNTTAEIDHTINILS